MKERPVCACEEGYVADPTTGLGCILPSTQPARKPVVRATPDYSEQIRPDREPFQSSGYSGYEYDRAAIRQVEALIPDLDIRKQYHRYRKSLERMRFSGSFNEYMRYQISVVKKRGTIAVLSAGALHALAGITFMIVAAATVNAVDGEETMAFYLAGGGNLIGAAIFLPVAAVRNTRNKRRLENLKGLQFKDEFSDY